MKDEVRLQMEQWFFQMKTGAANVFEEDAISQLEAMMPSGELFLINAEQYHLDVRRSLISTNSYRSHKTTNLCFALITISKCINKYREIIQ